MMDWVQEPCCHGCPAPATKSQTGSAQHAGNKTFAPAKTSASSLASAWCRRGTQPRPSGRRSHRGQGVARYSGQLFSGGGSVGTNFAKAETTSRDPLPRMPETPGSDFTIYVQVPRDVLDEWLTRTQNAVGHEAAVAEESRRGRYPHLDRRLQAQD